jgi:hypothetical protein
VTDPTGQQLARLIEHSYSRDEANAFAAFQPSRAQKAELAEVGKSVLNDCQPLAGSCMMMSALFAARLRAITGAPTHVVAGSLSVRGVPIFGHREAARRSFDVSDSSWDGHAWVMFGPLIADASLMRTARSPAAHPMLRFHIHRKFGEHIGLLIDHYADIAELGLEYSPRYILREREIEKVANGARMVFETD